MDRLFPTPPVGAGPRACPGPAVPTGAASDQGRHGDLPLPAAHIDAEPRAILTSLDRERRLEAISLSSLDVLEPLADAVLGTLDLEVSRGPSVGLLMVRVEEPSERLPFNFTEVTVSEAEVTAAGLRGYAMVLGRAPEKALAGAILDLALEAGHPGSATIEQTLRSALAAEEQRRRDDWARVAPTRVRFEEMAP